MKIKKTLLTLICGITLFGLFGCGSKLTNENLNKVKNGMTESEVQAILGSPSDVENSEILGLKNVSYKYKSGETRVNINFINNSVISKHGSFK
jgi:SmpA / OmlA family